MVTFYALSGALQIFDLHQSHDGYTPPPLMTALGRLHKQQVFSSRVPRQLPSPLESGAVRNNAVGVTGRGEPQGRPKGRAPSAATLLLKWLFFFEGLGLAATTALGTWIGLTQTKRRRTLLALLVLGTMLPLLLIAL
jgi:hypothetical protein